ncbi:MAG: HAD family phosphatase [Microthrixaceae bacterium]
MSGEFGTRWSTGLDAVIFDLDGVIRHYDRRQELAIERRHDLPAGSILTTAFGGPLGDAFQRGRIDRVEFTASLGEALGNTAAAREFMALRAEVDPGAVAVVAALQERVPVALLTNGSVHTRDELVEQGLDGVFEHVVNSAELGAKKPEPAAYRAALDLLGVEATRALFIDDHEPNVVGAREVGLRAHLYLGLASLTDELVGLGLRAS